MDFSFFFNKLLAPVISLVYRVAFCSLAVAAAFAVALLVKYRLVPWKITRDKLLRMDIRLRPANFIRWKIIDAMDAPDRRHEFREFGLTLYCGRQGRGKTVSMVYYLRMMRERYPECLIVTNFDCEYADHRMEDWQDFFKYRNGVKGVIIAIDEIHTEYSAASWRDFPEALLSEISQQRKQRVKIIASSQVYGRVVKAIREQTMTVVLCSTVAGRWTFCREYDAVDYEAFMDAPSRKIRSLRKWSFVQSDELRASYDTYEKIKRMRGREFIPRGDR